MYFVWKKVTPKDHNELEMLFEDLQNFQFIDSGGQGAVYRAELVQSIYGLTLNKLQHKLYQQFLVQKNVLYNILKVLRNPLWVKCRNFKKNIFSKNLFSPLILYNNFKSFSFSWYRRMCSSNNMATSYS